jgi:hypothetical protein
LLGHDVVIATLAHFAPKVNVKSGFPLRSRGKLETQMLDITTRPDPRFAPIEHLKWEAQRGADVVPLDARLAVSIAEIDVESFLRWHQDDSLFVKAESVGHDLLRLFGDVDGFSLFEWACDVMGTREEWTDEYARGMWSTYSRERRNDDRLLIDLMDDAQALGWQPSADIAAGIERLQHIAATVRDAEEAAIEAAEHARDAARQAKRDALDARKAEADRLLDESAARFEAAQDRICAAEDGAKKSLCGTALETQLAALDAELESEVARYQAEDAAWVRDYGIPLWPDSFDPVRKAARAKEQSDLAEAAGDEWVSFGPTPTQKQIDDWKFKYRHLMQAVIIRTPLVPVLPFAAAAPLPDLIQTSGAFVEGFVPPEYVLDRVLQRRFCYSVTAQTGVGKTAVAMLLTAHVAAGRALGALDVAKGSVLYFAGENPTDIQMRWLGLTQELKLDPRATDVHFVAGAVPLSQIAARIDAEVARNKLTLALVVVDTAAAYFEGDDENSNSQAADHARRMRSLTMLPGGPCVVILCHPTKRAADDDLIPRGGGAFLAEVDGNIALHKRESLIVASAQGKFRGADFTPINFELNAVTHPVLKDARGRDIWTVVAKPLTDAGKQQLEATSRRHEDGLLRAIEKYPGASLRELAEALRWLDKAGKPVAEKVRRAAELLAREKLIVKHRGAWQLTPKGQRELNDLDRTTADGNYPLTGVTLPVTATVQFPPIMPPK